MPENPRISFNTFAAMKLITPKLQLFLYFLFFPSILLYSQHAEPVQPVFENGSIKQQFDYIIEKSTPQNEFQLIRKTSIQKVRNNTLDTLEMLRNRHVNVDSIEKVFIEKINKIEQDNKLLNDSIKHLVLQIPEPIAEQNQQIDFVPSTEVIYITALAIFALLLILLIFLFVQLQKHSKRSKKAIEDYQVIENDYESYRKKTMKKEQELMRKLQDEINKNNP